ncbi:NADH:flavin oxidoreductase [Sphingopyxis sp. GC21]|uniref:NADH:flavin oxidoreductase n=1 Tax=Sphingopyxis sp. GC21 TaxID=2933562 RepID=UPI0021E3E715|nr:NADH:flavin oxidoreductase [Sphingopyxis sp. GC21]
MLPEKIADILSAPFKINKLTLANRLVMGPMAVGAPTAEGAPSEQTIAFFERRARGGIGMIIAGGVVATARSFEETPFKPVLRFDVESLIPQFRRVADTVHAHGVPIIAEIMPGFGRMGVPGPGRPIISASPINVVIPEQNFPKGVLVPGGRTTPEPDEATVEEIEQYRREMVDTASNVQRAGWDGVEVAAHMSYFASSFLSPRTNWRTDQYGGSVENRARMLTNIVRNIRERLGPDFVIGLRITANDYMPDGQGAAGFSAIAKEVEKAGLDYVALSTGCYETMDRSAPSVDGGLVDTGDARLFRNALSVPLLLQGLHDPARAAEAIADGHGDMVMLARPMLADPDYARKACSGRTDDIVHCTRDNLCMRRLVFNMPVRCSVNPAMGRESRKSGSLPPARRFIEAPVEKAILALTGSRRFMGLVGAVIKRRS